MDEMESNDSSLSELNRFRPKRAPRFSNKEVEILDNLVSKYKSVIRSSKTDALSNNMKNKAWTQLAKEFNSISKGPPRSAKILRIKLKNLNLLNRKKDFRAKLSEQKEMEENEEKEVDLNTLYLAQIGPPPLTFRNFKSSTKCTTYLAQTSMNQSSRNSPNITSTSGASDKATDLIVDQPVVKTTDKTVNETKTTDELKMMREEHNLKLEQMREKHKFEMEVAKKESELRMQYFSKEAELKIEILYLQKEKLLKAKSQ